MKNVLPALVIEPSTPATACVVWLHGLGADGHDFANVIPNLELPNDHGIRFVFPHAPLKAITINGGMQMPAWYDIAGIDIHMRQDEQGIKASEQAIQALIQQALESGIMARRIILLGFSQGGAMALHTALRYPQSLGGVGALSSYLPLHTLLGQERHLANAEISIFMAHGMMDNVVPYWLGQSSFNHLQEAGYQVQWHAYPMVHTVCLVELQAIGQWLKTQLGSKI